MLPNRSWDAYESSVKSIGERRPKLDSNDVHFLRELRLVEGDAPPKLTSAGNEYFNARFIRNDDETASKILKHAVSNLRPAAAIIQLLAGVGGATRDRAETVLRSQGFGEGLTDRQVGALLALMDRIGLIKYTKAKGELRVLEQPSHAIKVPNSVFISPDTPFGNRVWLRRILEECKGFIYWLDKHFTSAAFEALWEAADANRLSTIKILSLYLKEYHEGRKTRRDYENLARELAYRGIVLDWHIIDSKNIRDTHDRWIVSSNIARNIPNVNAIFSGQHSELNRSDQREELKLLFEGYWASSVSITTVWSDPSFAGGAKCEPPSAPSGVE